VAAIPAALPGATCARDGFKLPWRLPREPLELAFSPPIVSLETF
jgi:hypothetical protein